MKTFQKRQTEEDSLIFKGAFMGPFPVIPYFVGTTTKKIYGTFFFFFKYKALSVST